MNGFLTAAVQVLFIPDTQDAVPVRVRILVCAAFLLLIAGCGEENDRHADTGAKVSPAKKVAPPRALVARFKQVGRLPEPIQLPAAAPLNGGGALVIGGLDRADGSSAAIWRVTGARATSVGSLPAPLHDAAAATVGSRTLFVGGGNGGSSSSAVQLVSPGGVVTRVGSLPVAASDVAAARLGDAVYVIGGYDGSKPLDTIVRVDPSGRSRVVAHMPEPVRYAAVAAAGGRLVIAGGTVGTGATDAVLAFDPATRKVRQLGRLPAPLTHAAAAAVDSHVLVFGGRGSGLFSQRAAVLAIDPSSGHVRRAGRLPIALSDIAAVPTPRGLEVLGGRDARGGVHDEIWQVATAHVARASGIRIGRIPALLNRHDVYAAGRPGLLSPVARRAKAYVYVPNSKSDTVDVISQRSGRIVRQFNVGGLPQHVTPSWDLRTLYVTNDTGNSLTPINPRTGRPGRRIPVTDPYNLYFTADGSYGIVVAEALRRLEFYDAHSWKLHHNLDVPQCNGVDHMDFTADGRTALASCEFAGRMIVVDLVHERVRTTIILRFGAMPQDVKLSPDGRTFYVADMASNGVWLIDARTMRKERFIPTGRGAHGLYPSRDSRTLYVTNRGEGSISLIDFRTRRVRAKWHIPGGGSPDMGGLSADGKVLWLSGRYNAEVYAISTRSGRLLRRINVGQGPHGVCVWPQPGRYSIGHTGILR
jgi:DNA-binding beta-propeller fold protein YncE